MEQTPSSGGVVESLDPKLYGERMGFWRDLRSYFGALLWGDTTQKALGGLSLIALVFGSIYINPPVGAIVALALLMGAGFRLWRDERQLDDSETAVFKEIAIRLLKQVGESEPDKYRFLRYGTNDVEAELREGEFAKHFPKIAEAVDEWKSSPQSMYQKEWSFKKMLGETVPAFIQTSDQKYVIDAVMTYVRNSRNMEACPLADFGVSDDGERLTYLSDTVAFLPSDQNAYSLATEMNEWAQTMWWSPEAEAWREAYRDGVSLTAKVSRFLTDLRDKGHLTKRHCDKDCFQLLSGD